MTNAIKALIERAATCRDRNEALRLLREAVCLLEREIQLDSESSAFNTRYAGQPFEGADPFLRNFPRPNTG